MRYWNPRSSAAHRIVEDALSTYGAKRLSIIADQIAPIEPPEKAFAFDPKFSPDEQETYALFIKLGRVSSNRAIAKIVKRELSKYSTKRS